MNNKKEIILLTVIVVIIITLSSILIIKNNNSKKKKNSSGSEKNLKIQKIKIYSEENQTHKGIVYLDPTNLNKKCNESNYKSDFEQKKGCMKFYIFDESDTMYKMILDHNTTYTSSWLNYKDFIASGGKEEDWETDKRNDMGPVTAMRQLKNDTKNWQVKSRLINADEIAHIVGADSDDTIKWDSNKSYGTNIETESYIFYLDGGSNLNKKSYSEDDGWRKQVANSNNKSKYAWLYDYLQNCNLYGCKNKNSEEAQSYGYWTNDRVIGKEIVVWIIHEEGSLGIAWAHMATGVGIRPVIEIEKDKFE